MGLALALGAIVWQSSVHLPPAEAGLVERTSLRRGDDVLGPWLFWDAQAYTDIAKHGYTNADVDTFEAHGEARIAFFPGYPLVVRGVAALVGDTALAAMVVTFAAGLLLALVLHGWFTTFLTPDGAHLATFATFLFPWAFFFVGTGYSDALFVLCAVSAFALLERDQPVAAGLAGAMASGTRFVGVAVIVGLVVRAAERQGALEIKHWPGRLELAALRAKDGGVLLALGGLGGFAVFCWLQYGDPAAFAIAQRGWGQPAGPTTWFKLTLIEQIRYNSDHFFVLRLVVQGLVALVFLAAVPQVWRRLGAGYGMYTVIVLALPIVGSSAFQSHGRFVLAAFPVFGILGEWLAGLRRPRAYLYLLASGVMLAVVTSFWGRGYWMG